jgi:rubrerythrin
MKTNQDNWVCTRCGYTVDGKFTGDICPQCGLPYWKCITCGFTITAANPPDTCPECDGKCTFVNITCYTPDCGGPGKVDRRF